MAHLISFSIDGLAGRSGNYSQELNRDINVFFGLNGSGKTSLLKILHSAMSGDTTILHNVAFKKAEVKLYSVAAKKEYTLTATTETVSEKSLQSLISSGEYERVVRFSASGEVQEALWRERPHRWTWQIKPKLERGYSGRWSHRYLPTSRLMLGEGSAFRRHLAQTPNEVLSEEQLDQFFAVTLQDLWSSYSSGILTEVRKAQENGLASILKAVLSPNTQQRDVPEDMDPATAYQRVAAFLERQGSPDIIGKKEVFQRLYAENAQLRRVILDINEVEVKIERAMEPRKRLQLKISQMFSGGKRVIFQDKEVSVLSKEDKPINLRSLSSGEKHLLRICIETLGASDSTSIIDEPEISLHIDWQRSLIAMLHQLNPSAQLIIATHSPEIMAEIQDEKIFRI